MGTPNRHDSQLSSPHFLRRLARAFVRLFVIFLAFGVITVARGCAFRPQTNYSGAHFNRGQNAVWLSVDWVNQFHTTEEITTLANDLAFQQIRYVFAYTSYLHPETGEFNASFAHAAEFIQTLKQAQPQLTVLAWIGVPVAGKNNLSDQSTQTKIAGFSDQMVHGIGFDGIHLDAELILDEDPGFLATLDRIREVTKPALLSVATEKIQPIITAPLLPGWQMIGWSADYYRKVAAHVDQIAVMSYDTGMQIDWLYREIMRFEVIGITQTLKDSSVQLLFGIPTSEENTPIHDTAVENIQNGLQGLLDGLNDSDAVPNTVIGLALYPHWEMTSTKWAFYRDNWLTSLKNHQ